MCVTMARRREDIAVTSTLVSVHTDGACSGNPGPGGWGAILRWDGRQRELKGGEPVTTNNRMELMAAISALEALKRPCSVDLHTDSQYVRQGITQWIHNWKRNGWRTADKKPVKNADLWQRLDLALARHDIPGTGCVVMQATRSTSARINWRAMRSARCGKRKGAARRRSVPRTCAVAAPAELSHRFQQIFGARYVDFAGRFLDIELLHDAILDQHAVTLRAGTQAIA